jgi:hypothetical protein
MKSFSLSFILVLLSSTLSFAGSNNNWEKVRINKEIRDLELQIDDKQDLHTEKVVEMAVLDDYLTGDSAMAKYVYSNDDIAKGLGTTIQIGTGALLGYIIGVVGTKWIKTSEAAGIIVITTIGGVTISAHFQSWMRGPYAYNYYMEKRVDLVTEFNTHEVSELKIMLNNYIQDLSDLEQTLSELKAERNDLEEQLN